MSTDVSESPPNNVLKWLSKCSAVKVSECVNFGLNFRLIAFQNFLGCFFRNITNVFTFFYFKLLLCLHREMYQLPVTPVHCNINYDFFLIFRFDMQCLLSF